MTIKISGVSNNQSFGTWVTRTAQICDIVANNVLTADQTSSGNVTIGNTQFNGTFAATTLSANTLRGGTVNTVTPLTVQANVVVTGANSNLFSVTANATATFLSITTGDALIIPAGNTTVGGGRLNVNTGHTNVTSTTLAVSSVATFSGNVSLTGGTLTVNSNPTVNGNTVLNGANNNVNGTQLTVAANANLSGANTTVANAILTKVTFSSNVSFTTSVSMTGANVDVSGYARFTGKVNANGTLWVDTTNNHVCINTTTPVAGDVLTIVGRMTANTVRFPDGTVITTAAAFSSNGTIRQIVDSNSSVTVVGDQILITSNNVQIGALDSFSNGINFSGQDIRVRNANVSGSENVVGNITANGSIQGNSIVVSTASIGSETIATISYTVTNTDSQAIDAIDPTVYRSVDYHVQMSQDSTNSYHTARMLVVHDGTTARVTEYGTLTTNNSLGTLSSDIVSGQLKLILVPTVNSASVRIVRAAMLI